MPLIVSLIPQSGIQFLRLRLTAGDAEGARLDRTFVATSRQGSPRAGGGPDFELTAISPGDARAANFDRSLAMRISADNALRVFSRDWVPLPYFRIRAQNAESAPRAFDPTPYNWARLRLEPIAEESAIPGEWEAVLALDTAFKEPGEEGLERPDPSAGAGAQEFALCANFDDLGPFVAESWVDSWLEDMAGEPSSGQKRPLLHRALYLTFLEALARFEGLPRIRLIDIVSRHTPVTPVDVDFVLDVGNCRTCGILIEDHHLDMIQGDLTDSYPLELLDLARPSVRSAKPFESRVEFARARFGANQFAMKWESPLRVGPEAVRLSAGAVGNEGMTGVSTPKRYLWDTEPTRQFWHFNHSDPNARPVSVRGEFMNYVDETGRALCLLPPTAVRAPRARFSRSSLFMFMIIELLLQAIRQMNAPDNRERRNQPNLPRRLRRVALTIPTTMPMAEQALLRQHTQSAVWCVWRMMGWDKGELHTNPPPEVFVQIDEASATQLVFLYAMVKELFGGAASDFLALGVPGDEAGPPSLRLASIDIGGGTTDLMVVEYHLDRSGMLIPKQIAREGPKLAGDDLVRDIIQSLILPTLRDALAAAGVAHAETFLQEFFSGPGAVDAKEHFLRRQFLLRVLEPAAYAILSADEASSPSDRGEIFRRKLHETAPDPDTAQRALEHFDELARRAGGRAGATIGDAEIAVTAAQVSRVVKTSLGPMLVGLCALVRKAKCDWLLLSGRPSRLRAIHDIIVAELPQWPHRILRMHTLSVGSWYPFHDANGRIADPKTTAVVGAALAVYSDRGLVHFRLKASELTVRSTARFFGEVDGRGRIRADKVLASVPADERRARASLSFADILFTGPIALGFRQQDDESWPATLLYLLNWTSEQKRGHAATPLRVRLRRPEIDAYSSDPEPERERIEIVDVYDSAGVLIQDSTTSDADQTVRLYLRTSLDPSYWRDSAALVVGA